MITIAIIIFVFSSFFSNYQSQEKTQNNFELKVGDIAPDFSLKDQNGKLRALKSYRGQRVVLYYFPKADTPG